MASIGNGMTRKSPGKLFSAFTKADGSTSRRFGGRVSLAIARQLAR